jgi:hypothetical protein
MQIVNEPQFWLKSGKNNGQFILDKFVTDDC